MLPEWIKHQELLDKKMEKKKAAEETERIRKEEERKAEEAKAIKDYFKLLK